MQKLIIITSLVSFLCTYIYPHKPAHTLELKSSYFFFTQSPLNKVYNYGGFEESLSGSFPVWKWLNFYASAGIAHARGESLSDYQKTSLLEMPVGLGIKIVFPLQKKSDYYLTFGGRYTYLQQHNSSSFVDRNVHHHCGGFFINSGLNIFAKRHWVIGLFGEFAHIQTSITPHKLNVFSEKNLCIDNGAVGISIGYAF